MVKAARLILVGTLHTGTAHTAADTEVYLYLDCSTHSEQVCMIAPPSKCIHSPFFAVQKVLHQT